MSITESRRSPEEMSRLGTELYEREIRPRLRPEDNDKFVAIDVVSGDFEIDPNDFSAVTKLRTRRPEGEFWLARVGQPAAYRMGLNR